MPARSKGSLLVTLVALTGMGGTGCQSQLQRPWNLLASWSSLSPKQVRTVHKVAERPTLVSAAPQVTGNEADPRLPAGETLPSPVFNANGQEVIASTGPAPLHLTEPAVAEASTPPGSEEEPEPTLLPEEVVDSADTPGPPPPRSDAHLPASPGATMGTDLVDSQLQRVPQPLSRNAEFGVDRIAFGRSTEVIATTLTAGTSPDEQASGEKTLPQPRPQPPEPRGMQTGETVFLHPHEVVPGHPGLYPPPPPRIPREFHKRALSTYIVEPPDVLLIQGSRNVGLPIQPISGQHLVRPDGTIGLGIYGSVFVAGKTLEQIRIAIAELLHAGPNKKLKVDEIRQELDVDVIAYNSKYYYIITDGGGFGEQVYRVSITGNETVLDAVAQINGLPAVASKKQIWVARATPGHSHPVILPVDWNSIAQKGSAGTNYQLYPGDRIYVHSQKLIRIDSLLSKVLSPIERILGTTLLGATTVNAIRGRNTNSGF
jgi:polysaccharide export outer membrane protein